MKYVIIYWTRFGNNKKIVDYLAEKLPGDVQVFKTDEVDPAAMPDADYYIFSAAAEKFNIQKDMRKFMNALENMSGKKYGIINTHATKKNRWLKKMEKPLAKKNMVKAAELDFRMEGDVNNANGHPEGWENELDAFCAKLQ